MSKASGNMGHSSWSANEIGSKQWTLLMSGAEHNISSSCQELELVFKDVDRDFDIPCPVKIIRRLTVLEIALGQLKQDCEIISAKRRSIIQSVFADQSVNVGQTEKVCEIFNEIIIRNRVRSFANLMSTRSHKECCLSSSI